MIVLQKIIKTTTSVENECVNMKLVCMDQLNGVHIDRMSINENENNIALALIP